MTTEETLRDRLLPVLSIMLLYMQDQRLPEFEYKTTFPVMRLLIPEEWEIAVTVRCVGLIDTRTLHKGNSDEPTRTIKRQTHQRKSQKSDD